MKNFFKALALVSLLTLGGCYASFGAGHGGGGYYHHR